MTKLFKQFSFPGGIPSHAAPETPGSIHEGGELGYAISHAYGAAFDNPDLIVACVIGDGEAETGPLATSWHSNKFLNPAPDGAVLPILHLNGYKIANPTMLRPDGARGAREPLRRLRLQAVLRRRVRPGRGAPRDGRHARPGDRTRSRRSSTRRARTASVERPRWPMIVLRTPKGWTGPKEVDGKKTEDYWRSHQVPMAEMASEPGAPRAARGVAAQLPAGGALRRERDARTPSCASSRRRATRRMGANPHANGGLLLRDLRMPDFHDYAVDVPTARHGGGRGDEGDGHLPARRHEAQHELAELPRLRARRARLEPPRRDLRRDARAAGSADMPDEDDNLAQRRPGHGDPERAHVPGLARGLPADGPPRSVHDVRGLRPHRRLDVQPAREVAEGDEPGDPLAAPGRVAHLPARPRTSGARTTTASPIRTRGSSTTWSTRRPR